MHKNKYIMNNKITLLFILAIILASRLYSAVMEDSGSTVEVMTFMGPCQFWQEKDWISADTLIGFSDSELKENSADSAPEIATCFFGFVDYENSPTPTMLGWKHIPYFINIKDEEIVTFSVVYYDAYNNMPSSGYPKVDYWQTGTSNTETLALSYVDTYDTGWLYRGTANLANGEYSYKYYVTNGTYPYVYSLDISSFVVTGRPGVPVVTTNYSDGKIANAKVFLSWSSDEPDSELITYKLHLGTKYDDLDVVYEGENTYFEVKSLEYSKTYYWQVEALDCYGVSCKSLIYSFSTISGINKAFNYPNPFNPNRKSTNIVFNMQESGFAEIKIFSEYGDMCWEHVSYNLAKGANEIVFNGQDANGRVLYNGTYICLITKKYIDKEESEKCRILVIK